MQLCSGIVKHVYCVRPKLTVYSYIRIYCFNNRLTSRVYFIPEESNGVLLLGQHRRQLTNFKPPLAEPLVSAGNLANARHESNAFIIYIIDIITCIIFSNSFCLQMILL